MSDTETNTETMVLRAERHYCWKDPVAFPGRLVTPRCDPMKYEDAADLLFATADDAIAWRDEELDAWRTWRDADDEFVDEAEAAYIRRWVLCVLTIVPADQEVDTGYCAWCEEVQSPVYLEHRGHDDECPFAPHYQG